MLLSWWVVSYYISEFFPCNQSCVANDLETSVNDTFSSFIVMSFTYKSSGEIGEKDQTQVLKPPQSVDKFEKLEHSAGIMSLISCRMEQKVMLAGAARWGSVRMERREVGMCFKGCLC